MDLYRGSRVKRLWGPNEMIRTTYLMTTFLAAILLTGLGVVSVSHYIGYQGIVANWHWIGADIDLGDVSVGCAHWAYRGYLQNRRNVSVQPRVYVSLGLLGKLVVTSGTRGGKWRYLGVTVPLWTLVTLLFIHPAVAYVRGPLRRRQRHRRNQCVSCGYDRTGNESGVCPECGGRFKALGAFLI